MVYGCTTISRILEWAISGPFLSFDIHGRGGSTPLSGLAFWVGPALASVILKR
jgi:hypothetical protein